MDSLVLQAEEFFKNNIPKSRDKKAYMIHVELVRKYAIELGDAYSANLIILEVAALLHDIGADAGSVHAQKSAEISEKFLTENGTDAKRKEKILSAIKNHSMMQTGGCCLINHK
ncbi:MAG: HD domain-containing protein, partial [Candidatus Aenigmarchaeota archaeon]|nr:HD domain-containing protein [Candidatus Aenigmarchaeota archaeon]